MESEKNLLKPERDERLCFHHRELGKCRRREILMAKALEDKVSSISCTSIHQVCACAKRIPVGVFSESFRFSCSLLSTMNPHRGKQKTSRIHSVSGWCRNFNDLVNCRKLMSAVCCRHSASLALPNVNPIWMARQIRLKTAVDVTRTWFLVSLFTSDSSKKEALT